MRRVGVLVESHAERTALETVDLALAAGLLDIEVTVLLRGEGCRHLYSDDETVRGRWRTLVDFCPARVCAAQECRQTQNGRICVIQPEYLDAVAFERELTACDHVLRG